MNAQKGSFNEFGGPRPLNVDDHSSQFSAVQSQNINNGSIRVPGGTSNVKILSKAKDHMELNGSETGLSRPTLQPVGNRDKTEFSQSKSGSHGRPGISSVGKHHNRYSRFLLEYLSSFCGSLGSEYNLLGFFQGSWGCVKCTKIVSLILLWNM